MARTPSKRTKRQKLADPAGEAALKGSGAAATPSSAQGHVRKDGSGVGAPPSAPSAPKGSNGSGNGAGTGGVDDPDDDSEATLLLRIQDDFTEYTQGNSDNLERANHDDGFLVGQNHWDPKDEAERAQNQRPSLVVNTVNLPYFQVTNDIRQNLPQAHIIPNDDDAHEETARILEGLYRHMNFRCGGNEKRLQAVNHAVSGGYGYYGLKTAYANERDFAKELALVGVHNRALIVDDPKAREPDRRDRRALFLCGSVPKREFRKKYPHNSPDNAITLVSLPEALQALWSEKDVPEIEYWWREIKEVRTISDAGEEEVDEDVLDDETGEVLETRKAKRPREQYDDGSAAMMRDVVIWHVKGCLTNGAEILKDRRGRKIEWTLDLPWIPWFLVQGWTINLKGEWHYEGVFHQAIDPQKLRDYGYTAIAEMVGQESKATIMAPKGTFENYEYKWDSRNKRPWATLEYNVIKAADGMPIPPMPVPKTADPSAAIALTQQSTQMLRDATGMYPVEQGGSPNDPLGTAKSPMLPGAMRQQRIEGDMNHFHYMAGLAIAMKFEVDCFLWLAPKVYGGKNRVERILGADGTERNESVTLNQPQPDPGDPEQDLPLDDPRNKAYTADQVPDGSGIQGSMRTVKGYNLNVGKYGTRIEIGPSFATQREETLTLLGSLQQALGPGAAPLLAPFIVKAAGVQDHEKLSRAFMAMLPPNIQMALSDGQGGQDDANQLKAKLAQLVPIVQQLMQMNQQLQSEVDDKRREQMIKVMTLAQKHVSETIQAISHVTGQQIKSEADLLKDFIAGARSTQEQTGRSTAAVGHTSSVAEGAEQRIEVAGEKMNPGGAGGAAQ